jgi:mRNA-degrading endonuclease RelE of RelBE toxin-antitoxin system
MATVVATPEAQVPFQKLPVAIQARIEKIFVRLRNWPAVSGAKPLRASLAGRYRMRTGDYRVQFFVVGDVVTVEKVGHRDRFYED